MAGSKVYIGGLPYGTRERDLEKFFKGYGRFSKILIKNGYGFVEFDDGRDADDAVYELNGKKILGERVSVEIARGGSGRRENNRGFGRRRNWNDNRQGPPTRTEHRLIVENLSSRVSWQDLKDYIRQAGEVTFADAHKLRKNEGVVEFASYSDMKNAIEELDSTELNGRKIRLFEDKRRGRHPRSLRSRSRSRKRGSRSPSRSRRSSDDRNNHRSRSKSRANSTSKSPAQNRSRSKSKSQGKSKSKSKSTSRSRSRNGRSKSGSHS